MTKKRIIRFVLIILLIGLIYGAWYAWRAFPLISGYGAKDLCSCVFLSGRTPQDVVKKELGDMPFSLGSFSLDRKDSSATGKVFGLAKRKAIFRKGLGCTLMNGVTEKEWRDQPISLTTPLPVNPDSISWPMGDRLTGSRPPGINYEQLEKAIDEAFKEPGEKPKRQTRAVIVLYEGQIIEEKYAPGFNVHIAHTGWSMAKSVTNALTGILVRQQKLDIHSTPGFAEWKKDDRNNITIDQLLHANSGLKWEEVYTGPSDVTNMLHKEKDMAAFAIKQPLKHSPGTFFTYSSGTSNILSYIIRRNVGDENYYRFPYQELFYKTGMYSAILEPDASGTFVGSSYCFATARDWARFGLLYLNDGVWNGERILPEGWVKYSATPSKGALQGEYGAQFWLNAGAPGNPANRTYPDVPTDCFYADGYEGQDVWIIPSKKLVVVKLAMQHGNKLDENKFLAEIIKGLP
jgi:CubicO group peptidase (beta-lactamase class C family)